MEQIVSVKELKQLVKDGKTVEIETPDGYKKITEWFDKGIKPMVKIKTVNHETVCATNHLLQMQTPEGFLWEPAENIKVADVVLTNTGWEEVIETTSMEDMECYDFTVDSDEHRYFGDGFSSHNSGKSFIASGNIVKWCQDNGVLPVIIDTENALDEAWMKNFNIDPNGYIMKISAAKLDDIAKIMSDFVAQYKGSYKDLPFEEKPKVLFIIDSLGMAITPTEIEQFDKGDMKGDMGRKQKQIYSICRNFVASCGDEPIGLLATQHTYVSQDMFNPDAKIAGGSGLEFTPSVIIAMTKRKLKEDENGDKTSDVRGIKVNAMVRKTRYAQPFQPVCFNIPWDSGMDAYSGLFELFSESITVGGEPILKREGNQYVYDSVLTGELVFKKFRKAITHEDYDRMMEDYSEYSKKLTSPKEETVETVEDTPEE